MFERSPWTSRLVTTEGVHRFESVANIEFDTDSNMIETIAGLQNTTAGGDITIIGSTINLNP